MIINKLNTDVKISVVNSEGCVFDTAEYSSKRNKKTIVSDAKKWAKLRGYDYKLIIDFNNQKQVFFTKNGKAFKLIEE